MNEGLVSIVIPCYNDADYVEQSVASALQQTYPYKEIIVVDDGSNEQTKNVLKTIEPKITKLITQENKGQSTARNAGINEAKGDYILVLDSDDFFEPTFCEKAILFFNQSDVKIVTCYAKLLFENNRESYVFKHIGGSIKNFLTSNRALGSAMFKKKEWERVNGYDESMKNGFEDWEFYIRILKNGGIAEVVKEPLYNYRKRNHSTTSRANVVKYDLLKFIFTKHQDLYVKFYDDFIDQLLFKLQKEEKEKIKNTERLEFKIGKAILRPLRYIKSLLK